MDKMNRRNFIKSGVVGGALGLFASSAYAGSPTPEEIEGPFYPVFAQKDKDFDLTRIEGKQSVAKGRLSMSRGKCWIRMANQSKMLRLIFGKLMQLEGMGIRMIQIKPPWILTFKVGPLCQVGKMESFVLKRFTLDLILYPIRGKGLHTYITK